MLVERYLNSRIRSAHRGEPNTAFLQLVICRDWEIVPSIRRTSIPDFPIYYRRGHANVKSIKEYRCHEFGVGLQKGRSAVAHEKRDA